MGTIKDVVDLTTQLANSIQDRKVAPEILKIQTLILSVQKEDATPVSENFDLKKKIFELEKENLNFQKKHSEEISNLQKKILALEEKSSGKSLRDKYTFNSTYGVYESKESGHYFCTSCLMKNIESPLTTKDNGWQCELKGCDKFYSNLSYQPPQEEKYDPFRNL